MRVARRIPQSIATFFCFALVVSVGWKSASANASKGVGPEQATITIPVGVSPISLAVGDVNSDLYPDIVVGGSPAMLILNDGAGGFLTPTPINGALGTDHHLKDLNNDGKLDLFYLKVPPSQFQAWESLVRLGDGSGGFGEVITTVLQDGALRVADLKFADFNSVANLCF